MAEPSIDKTVLDALSKSDDLRNGLDTSQLAADDEIWSACSGDGIPPQPPPKWQANDSYDV
jgi:hypothetical protein